ncbi:M23 family metallopeptidase [Actinoplanes sp. NPDC049265]|uniref:M23 family metallopeptidase n=1 Tax=Actinoplanes sp. NPDC049265 TaxID=3363902 RepID=UPI0037125010
MRQRLSSEPDRYRGRRRVPTPPRSRYAVVGTAALLGAGVVALGAANLPDTKDVSPSVLRDLDAQKLSQDIAARDHDKADRSSRDAEAATTLSEEDLEAKAWLLPLEDFQFTAPFGMRLGQLHSGIDLAAPEGLPFKAVHAGTVTKAGWDGGYGFAITVRHDDGTEAVYAHARRLVVKAGDKVKAGQVIGQVGNTGYSYGTHLHLEIHEGGKPIDPVPFLRERGADVKLQIDSPYS